MTFRSPRVLLAVALLFLAAGVVMACGPYSPPGGCPGGGSTPGAQIQQSTWTAQVPSPIGPGIPPGPPATPPVPVPPPGLPQPQPHAYTVPPAPPSCGPVWNLSVVEGKLHLQTSESMRSTCEKLTILANGAEPVAVAVVDNLIRLTAGKDECETCAFLQATASSVSRTGPDGATLILKGDVRLVYVRKGKKIDVSAELLSLNLTTGQIISEMDAPKLVVPLYPPVQPVQPVTNTCPPPVSPPGIVY